jgi:outer membrane protein assembly factor BamB
VWVEEFRDVDDAIGILERRHTIYRLIDNEVGLHVAARLIGNEDGQLNSPWGMAMAPAGFGELGGTLWVGNFGNGQINAFDPQTGQLINKVRDPHGQALVIDGLWSLQVGNGANVAATPTPSTSRPDQTTNRMGSSAASVRTSVGAIRRHVRLRWNSRRAEEQ